MNVKKVDWQDKDTKAVWGGRRLAMTTKFMVLCNHVSIGIGDICYKLNNEQDKFGKLTQSLVNVKMKQMERRLDRYCQIFIFHMDYMRMVTLIVWL